jgi:P pilus assembly chaperone PapD
MRVTGAKSAASARSATQPSAWSPTRKGAQRERGRFALLLLISSICWAVTASGLAAAAIGDDAGAAVTVIPASADFPSVVTGTTNSQTITLMNTGPTAVAFSNAIVEGEGFRLSDLTVPFILAPKSALTFNIEFSPRGRGGAAGSVSLLQAAGDARILIPLSGTGEAPVYGLQAYPARVIFGSAKLGEMMGPEAVSLTNTGNSDLVITRIDTKGEGFSVSGISLPARLAPGQNVSVDMTFLPEAGGDAEGNLQIFSDALPQIVTVPLSGTGKAATRVLEARPSNLLFKSASTDTTDVQPVTVFNTGNSSVTITDISVTEDSYSISGVSLPVTLAPGENVSFHVAYSPGQTADDGGSVTIASDAYDSPTTVSLTSSLPAPGQQSAVNLA